MGTASLIAGEVAVSTVATTAIATSVNAEPLLTALIGFGTALVTMAGGEFIKFLVAWLKNKREKLEKKEDDKNGKDIK